MVSYFREIIEKQVFGVCQWWGNKLGIKTSNIRLFFIYTSCMALGSPLIVYLIMAFILKHKDSFKGSGGKRKRIWDL
jgi:phage shock protein C